jgi:carboxypeptidase Q
VIRPTSAGDYTFAMRTALRLTATLFVALPTACGLTGPDEGYRGRIPGDDAPLLGGDAGPGTPDASEPAADASLVDRYRGVAMKIMDASVRESRAQEKLQHLCTKIGHRLSGSEGLEKAVRWAKETFEKDGVVARLEPVTVPAWIRGKESAMLLEPEVRPLHMLGLGNSIGTPDGGITAEVVCARSFDELDALGAKAKGKIVLFTARMPPYDVEKGSGYGDAVVYRVSGASRAAIVGAVAVLVRSVTAGDQPIPHTGMLRYDGKMPKVPAAALSTADADYIEKLWAAGKKPQVRLDMDARFGPDAQSANVVAEIPGARSPEEVVVFGGHLDSWDVGQGAQDDGGPCTAVMEAMRILKSLDLKPRRTIRAVLFVNEENGLAGGRAYAEAHKDELKNHVAAIEADTGAYRPLGFTSPRGRDERTKRINARLEEVVSLLKPIGAGRRRDGGGGADIGPMEPAGVPQIGLDVDGRQYFDWHHTEADTFDKVSKTDLDLCVAALATTVFVIADMPERLGD